MDLLKTECVENPGLESAFLADLPMALLSLVNGQAPGIDGIPAEFLDTAG